MIKTIALMILLAVAGCQASIRQDFDNPATTETPTDTPTEEGPSQQPTVILEGRVVLPDSGD